MRKPTAHDPVTYWRAYHLNGEGRTRSKYGYICYATQDCPSNSAPCYPGFGDTEKEALLNAQYWSNQDHCVRVVPYGQAPQWAIEKSRN